MKDSDLSSVYSLAQALGQSWTSLVHHSLGAPYEADLALAFIPDDLHLIVMRILVHLTNNPITAVNAFYVLSFGLCSIAFLVLCDAIKIRRYASVPLSVAYSWLPYHFTRMNDGHVFLAAYYMVPIGLLILVCLISWLTLQSGSGFSESRWRRGGSLLLAVAVGSSGAYYGLFFSLLTLCCVVLIPVRGQQLRQTLAAITWTGTVALFFVLAPLSRNLWARFNGLETVLTRSPAESIQWGGSVSRLLVPWGVWTPRDLSLLVERQEYEWLAVPLLAVIGVWIVILSTGRQLFRLRSDSQPGHLAHLGFLFTWSLLFFLAGGMGAVFAYSIDPSFRTWNRFSIVLMTIALAALAEAITRVPFKTVSRSLIGPSILVIAVATQLVPIRGSGISDEPDLQSRTEFEVWRESARTISRVVPKGCSILQLPIMAFPEGGEVDGVVNGEHLWLPLLAPGYHWSYGAPKGSEAGDFWTSKQFIDLNDMINFARDLDFCAVVIIQDSDVLDRFTETSSLVKLTVGHLLSLQP